MTSVNDVLAKYIEIREQKRELVSEHEAALKPLDEKLEKMEMWLLAQMQEVGVDSFKTEHGTAFKTTKFSSAIADLGIFKDFVVSNGRWDLVDMRSLRSGVQEFVNSTGQVPPGLNVTSTVSCNIRRK